MRSFLQNFGEYQILEKLGRGGMADVYLALDSANDRRVALKLVEHGEGEEAQEVVAAERLGAELQKQLCLVEPRVPRINNYGDREEFFFIDMEYIEGRDLSEVIRSGPLEPHAAAGVAREICSVLRNAHSLALRVDGRELRAIVHGDIKPKNIRIDLQNGVRVLDFGIAKGLTLTRRLTRNVFGSAAYSSPERLESGRIDEMSDLWSVGVVLYETVAGHPPFLAPSTEQLETIVRSHRPPLPLDHACPPDLQCIIFKALAQSPARRYQSAEQFESDLSAFLSGAPTLARQESDETRRSVPEGADETRRTGPDDAGETRRSSAGADAPVTLPPAAPEHAQVAIRRRPLWLQRVIKVSVIAIPALLLGLGLWEGFAYRAAVRMEPSFAQLDGDKAWDQYQQVKSHSFLGIAAIPLRSPLSGILHKACDRVVDEYRNSNSPRVREGDWIRCKRYMSHAVELDPSDKKAAAMLEYANGHILRINRKDTDAVAAFQRAAAIETRWPDPYLGMARTYIYNLKDVERGTQAMKRAQELGYSFGNREKAMMADAYQTRGLRYYDGADQLRDSEQEKELLKKAKDDLKQALQMYSEIAPWGDTTNQIRITQDTLNQIDLRLKALEPPPNPLFPWNWFKRQY